MDKLIQEKLLELVKRNYSEIAQDFSDTRKKYLWPELIKLTSSVKDGDKVLDIGCGNARLLEAFKGRRVEYCGIDSSEELIQIAKRESQNVNRKFIIGNILDLDKIKQSDFDFVFCVAVLHHIPGKDLRVKALEQLKNKVKADGEIIITVWNLWSQPKFRKLFFKHALLKIIGKCRMDFNDIIFTGFKQGSDRYYHGFTKYELKKIANLAGLKIKKLYKDKFNYYLILNK